MSDVDPHHRLTRGRNHLASTWADQVCPVCRGRMFGPVGALSCAADHPPEEMLPEKVWGDGEQELVWCNEPAPEKARRKGVGECVKLPEHGDEHVWWQQVGTDLLFFGHDGRVIVKALLRNDARITQKEAVVLWQYLDYLDKSRPSRLGSGVRGD